MNKILTSRAWAIDGRRVVPSIMIVVALVMVSAASVIVASDGLSKQEDEGLGDAAARLGIVALTGCASRRRKNQ